MMSTRNRLLNRRVDDDKGNQRLLALNRLWLGDCRAAPASPGINIFMISLIRLFLSTSSSHDYKLVFEYYNVIKKQRSQPI
jgi:hypothetical protein